jgi:serine/threonine protein kinase
MECPKCHSLNSDRARYCEDCGTLLATSSSDINETQTQASLPSAKEPVVGKVFAGRYFIIEELGAGGMGKVYRARDQKVNEIVALKLIKPEIANQPKVLERFRNELVIARKIVHKYVGRMFELMEAEGVHFITMEYIPGENLRVFIKRSREMTEGVIVTLAEQICEGLAEAHRMGVVHRDIKPSNIMIDREGNAKITDFGIARSFAGEGTISSGDITGTPDYMSPEQVDGKGIDAQSDIYSLGITLYEMSTGRLPFEGETPLSVAVKQRAAIPKPPRYYRPQLSDGLNKLIIKCLEKDKEKRYINVGQVLEDLKNLPLVTTASLSKQRNCRKPFSRLLSRKEAPAAKPRKRWRKWTFKSAFVLCSIYIIALIIGVINDSIYRSKLEKVAVEYDTYYKNFSPVHKTWLPADWPLKDCNAIIAYKRIFPQKVFYDGRSKSKEELDQDPYYKVFDGFDQANFGVFYNFLQYDSREDLLRFRDKYSKYFSFLSELQEAARCSKISAGDDLIRYPNTFYYNGVSILWYVKYAIIDARLDFINNRNEDGFRKLHLLLVFALDLSRTGKFLAENLIPALIFKLVYKDLIAGILSNGIDYSVKALEDIVELSIKILDQLDISKTCYREYIWSGKIFVTNTSREMFGIGSGVYFFLNRFGLWKFGFSKFRVFYQELGLYKDLFAGIKYIKSFRDKSIFLKDYFIKTKWGIRFGMWAYFADLPSAALKYNIRRTLLKTFLLIYYYERYGLESKEFLSLKGTDSFINEFSGKPFVINAGGNGPELVMNENSQLSLRKIDYAKEHKNILSSLKLFDAQNTADYKSLFYSFELE